MAMTVNKFTIPASAVVTDGKLKMKSADIGPDDMWDFGAFYYADLTTATTAITVPVGGAFVVLTNDGDGSETYKSRPDGVTEIYNDATNQFDFSELALGDMVDIRVDIEFTTTAVNQEIDLVLETSQPTGLTTIPVITKKNIKAISTVSLSPNVSIFIGDTDTRDQPGQFKIASAVAGTCKVKGWFCKVTKRGFTQA